MTLKSVWAISCSVHKYVQRKLQLLIFRKGVIFHYLQLFSKFLCIHFEAQLPSLLPPGYRIVPQDVTTIRIFPAIFHSLFPSFPPFSPFLIAYFS
jgi:hypothetical protein